MGLNHNYKRQCSGVKCLRSFILAGSFIMMGKFLWAKSAYWIQIVMQYTHEVKFQVTFWRCLILFRCLLISLACSDVIVTS